MKSVSVREMKRLDLRAIKRFGIPALILMENAGGAAAQEALKMLPKKGARRVALFCGYGNNGGDGFVCLRHLLNKGVQAQVYLVGENKTFSPETQINQRILRNMKQRFKLIKRISALGQVERELKGSHLIIDGIFGIGLRGAPETFYQELFGRLNSAGIPILALDIPSGMDADTGRPLGEAVRAARTVTFGLMKKGLVNRSAGKFSGKVVVADISLPRK